MYTLFPLTHKQTRSRSPQCVRWMRLCSQQEFWHSAWALKRRIGGGTHGSHHNPQYTCNPHTPKQISQTLNHIAAHMRIVCLHYLEVSWGAGGACWGPGGRAGVRRGESATHPPWCECVACFRSPGEEGLRNPPQTHTRPLWSHCLEG